ncbi:MAG: methylmalonyl-CoA mutase family protein [Chitinophagaceae bacterium]|nr:methylmalonyl-CoA mutase family protein [Chitinophagaceae bacterium]
MNNITEQKIRIVTAASLFDGHDAAINIMRRIMQAKGAEIIHLGHNRSVAEIVECAIEEDAHGIAITSYQGGHVEFFKYMKDLLDENGCGHIKIFGGGGGTILPTEIKELHDYGITKIYSPDDGRTMGLEGMIEDLLQKSKDSLNDRKTLDGLGNKFVLDEHKDILTVSQAITKAENGEDFSMLIAKLQKVSGSKVPSLGGDLGEVLNRGDSRQAPVLGITGTGGAGKSSVTDEIVRRFLHNYTNKTIAVISVDPSKKKTGGALLGDRIRMNAISSPRAYMRSLATRESDKALSKYVQEAIDICKAADFDLIILESAGVGQSDASILDYVDVSMYVMTPEYGAPSQLEKINMLDYADVVCVNKFDKAGALDALNDVRKQYKRNHGLWTAKDDELPIIGTIAAQFNDTGVNELFKKLMQKIAEKTGIDYGEIASNAHGENMKSQSTIIPPKRVRYLAEIAETITAYDEWVEGQSKMATQLYQLKGVAGLINTKEGEAASSAIAGISKTVEESLDSFCKKLINQWPQLLEQYQKENYEFKVRDKIIKQPLTYKSLSGTVIPKVILPKYKDWGDILKWQLQENVPGEFPFTAGVFPLKREGEDPTRMFAGEGGPERTNRRFHYVSVGQPAKRLSTAFDSVTLYGEDPAYRPDIYGKVGNSGVSIATVDDAKKLYSGFDLCDPKTSVSMTINGPAPMLLAFFMNAAIDQQCEKYIIENNLREQVNAIIESKYDIDGLPKYIGIDGKPIHHKNLPKLSGSSQVPSFGGDLGEVYTLPEGNNGLGLRLLGLSGKDVLPADVYEQIKAKALSTVRGTVQADILKEDQAQNTCIFSTEFALKLMGDVQEYFIQNNVQNFYSVSISGYHIAEAGANPITQLAFTLSNGFTYVEYYLSRGMNIDDFAPNLSFFFSNGMDPEYSVIGRVARRIWAKAMKNKYKGNSRSQKLKYHIQTSGRSLHAQEIDFNDIRTTLQALYAIYDNCNSLHTNAYDEAITTPTEESVRRAMAIQLIINRELGTAKNENPNQGSFLIEELTDLVEQAVLAEFNRITERGGVLGAMERMYQRNKIQEESLYYETLKHTGQYPIVGVNTFLNKKGSPTIIPQEVIRSTEEEKQQQINTLQAFKDRHAAKSAEMLQRLQKTAVENGNLFEELMETVKYCSLGQITTALYAVGGQYRRNM